MNMRTRVLDGRLSSGWTAILALAVLLSAGCAESESLEIVGREVIEESTEEMPLEIIADANISNGFHTSTTHIILPHEKSVSGAEENTDIFGDSKTNVAHSESENLVLQRHQDNGNGIVISEEPLALTHHNMETPLKLLIDSVNINDCVMRGLIYNSSDEWYAKNVTIIISAIDSDKNVSWYWPLTIEPGEKAPFEVGIDWFPHSVKSDLPHPALNEWNLLGNTNVDISADMSLEADVKRAFSFNQDYTEYEPIFQSFHRFPIFDERALELEDYKLWRRYGRDYSPIATHDVELIFPEGLVKGKEVEPMVSEFQLYKYADIYYIPHTLYPNLYDEETHSLIDDVRVYQTYMLGSEVADVWELIPHTVSEVLDSNGLVIEHAFMPRRQFEVYGMSESDQVFVQFWTPIIDPSQFPNRNVSGEAATHKGGVELASWSDIWMGGVSHTEVSEGVDILARRDSSKSSSCYAPGGLRKSDFIVVGQQQHVVDYTLGYAGIFDEFHTEADSLGGVTVDTSSVTIDGNTVRGLIHNQSENEFGRNVEIIIVEEDSDEFLGEWYWPLSIQPGERAPFEIELETSGVELKKLRIEANASLSMDVDITRAFKVMNYTSGTVYAANLAHAFASDRYFSDFYPGRYLNLDLVSNLPNRRYEKSEFLATYKDIISIEDYDDIDLLHYRDLYARLEASDSHPLLSDVITTQHIESLRAFGAILDDEMRVVDVMELSPFTSVYGHINIDRSYLEVNRIPAPNRWSPNAVRLLLTVPFANLEELARGYYFQVWIGGTMKSDVVPLIP